MLTAKYNNHEVRVVEVQGVKYVILIDIMKILGMKSNSQVYSHTNAKDRTIVTAKDSVGGKRKLVALNRKALGQLLEVVRADREAKDFLRGINLGTGEFVSGRIKFLEEQVEKERFKREEAAKLYSKTIDKVAKENYRISNLVDGLKNELDILEAKKTELLEDYIEEVNELTDEILELEEKLEDRDGKIEEYRKGLTIRDIQIDNLMAENYYLENETLLDKFGRIFK